MYLGTRQWREGHGCQCMPVRVCCPEPVGGLGISYKALEFNSRFPANVKTTAGSACTSADTWHFTATRFAFATTKCRHTTATRCPPYAAHKYPRQNKICKKIRREVSAAGSRTPIPSQTTTDTEPLYDRGLGTHVVDAPAQHRIHNGNGVKNTCAQPWHVACLPKQRTTPTPTYGHIHMHIHAQLLLQRILLHKHA